MAWYNPPVPIAPTRMHKATVVPRVGVGSIFAPLGDGHRPLELRAPPSQAVETVAVPRLGKLDRHLVLWVALGLSQQDIAERCGKSVGWVQTRLANADVAASLKRIGDLAREKIERGEYGVSSIAKAEAEPMARALISIAKSPKSTPAVKRLAALDVLALAGHQPVKRAEILNVNELIDKMTPDELDSFINKNEWPERLRDSSLAAMVKPNRPMIDVTPDGDD